jgi:hypothetical protein
MFSHETRRCDFAAMAVALWALALTGCACWNCPRIDPTGERLFVWPGETQAVVGPAGAVVPAPPVATGAPLFGNVLAPPV